MTERPKKRRCMADQTESLLNLCTQILGLICDFLRTKDRHTLSLVHRNLARGTLSTIKYLHTHSTWVAPPVVPKSVIAVEMDLQDNTWNNMSETLCKLPRLLSMYVRAKPQTSGIKFPVSFTTIAQRLLHLHLKGNQVYFSNITEWKKLTTLHLSGAPFGIQPGGFPKLCELYCSKTKKWAVPTSLVQQSSLRSVWFKNPCLGSINFQNSIRQIYSRLTSGVLPRVFLRFHLSKKQGYSFTKDTCLRLRGNTRRVTSSILLDQTWPGFSTSEQVKRIQGGWHRLYKFQILKVLRIIRTRPQSVDEIPDHLVSRRWYRIDMVEGPLRSQLLKDIPALANGKPWAPEAALAWMILGPPVSEKDLRKIDVRYRNV